MTQARKTMNIAQTLKYADDMAALDRKNETMEDRQTVEIHLDRIQDRQADSRKLTPTHVTNLIESIDAIGLLEPLVVDRDYRLLAGAHRLAAIRELHATRPDVFAERFPAGMVPVRVVPIDATVDREAALGIEVAENAQRRNYSPAEIDRLAKRLAAAGYADGVGKPRDGEKRLLPALAVIIGRSTRTVRRQLREVRSQDASSSDPESLMRPNGRIRPQGDERTYAANAGKRIAVIIDHYQALGQDALGIVEPLRAASQAIAALIQSLSKEGLNAQSTR